MAKNVLPDGYAEWAESIKARVQAAQTRAALAATRELIVLYWEIGQEILDRQERQGWGAKVIERLAADLRTAFPTMKGFSRTNLLYMRSFAAGWPDREIVPQLAGRLPWGHNRVLLDKVGDADARRWYAAAAIEHGWSRDMLVHRIEHRLRERLGSAPNNFGVTLPSPQSDLARQTFKDPYLLDFLTLAPDARERDLERGLQEHLKKFLLELGKGFAFMGTQYPLQVGDREFYIDMLFFHTRLMCHIVIELKVGEFKPEHTGKMNFYLNAVDDLLKGPGHNRSIGLILCKEKDHLVVQYALHGVETPIGVAEYVVGSPLPETLSDMLPTVEEFEAQLGEASSPEPLASSGGHDEESKAEDRNDTPEDFE
ncbi:PDDEXK nuclease domain-containing protein [Azospirillum sp. 11R-A]|uniref:PDDEXK nuclease domain-containing protein n=1 Tax=Azospirillum sp. 11R-A TaxID=3111634 RepID=UPI003C21267A